MADVFRIVNALLVGLQAHGGHGRKRVNRSVRLKNTSAGFLLMDVLIAAAVIFAGLSSLVNLMPQLLAMSQKQSVIAEIADYGLAKQQDILTGSYAAVGASASGDFNLLLGAGATNSDKYTWRYTSAEEIPKVLKEVTLYVDFADGSVTKTLGPWVFYVTDLADNVP